MSRADRTIRRSRSGRSARRLEGAPVSLEHSGLSCQHRPPRCPRRQSVKTRPGHARNAVARMIWYSSLWAASGRPQFTSAFTDPGRPRSSGQQVGNYALSHALSSSRHPRTEPVVQQRPSQCCAHPSAAPGLREMVAVVSCVDPRKSASQLGVRSNRPSARDVPRPSVGLSGMLPWPPCPAFNRRSFGRFECAADCSEPGRRPTGAQNPGAQLAWSWWPSRFRRATVLRCGRGRRAAPRSAHLGP